VNLTPAQLKAGNSAKTDITMPGKRKRGKLFIQLLTSAYPY